MDEHITLDNWKPTTKINTMVKSQWRKEANGDHFDQKPGLDEIRKIKTHIKKSKKDYEIMEAFGIDCETLIAIKKDKYHPIDGISMDNLSKIYKAFGLIEKKITNLYQALNMLSDNAFDDKQTAQRMLFKSLIKVAKKKTITQDDFEDDEEFDDEDEIE